MALGTVLQKQKTKKKVLKVYYAGILGGKHAVKVPALEGPRVSNANAQILLQTFHSVRK